jgi:hypothetical protein
MQDDNQDWLDEDAAPDGPSAPGEEEAVQQIDFDLNCVTCGYNLRSALSTGTCPECGEPVDTSLRPDLLHMAQPAWLGKLRKGMNWLVTAIVMSLIMIPVVFIIAIATEVAAGPNANSAMPTIALIFIGVLGTIITITYIIAVWLITEPESDIYDNRVSRTLARCLILPGMALSLVSQAFSFSNQNAAMTVGGWIDLISTVMLLVGFLASLWYLRQLANRIPEPGLARQTMIVFWGNLGTYSAMIVVSLILLLMVYATTNAGGSGAFASLLGIFGLMMCPLMIAMLVFGIWWIVLMFRYRTRFTQAHVIALSQSDAANGHGSI